jgi:hypothetical protein
LTEDIFRRLATQMGFTDPELVETDDAIIETLLRQVGWNGDFATLAAQRTFYPSIWPVIPFEAGVFPTPSHKIEIALQNAVRDGHPLAPVPHADPPTSNGRIRVLSAASEWTMKHLRQ